MVLMTHSKKKVGTTFQSLSSYWVIILYFNCQEKYLIRYIYKLARLIFSVRKWPDKNEVKYVVAFSGFEMNVCITSFTRQERHDELCQLRPCRLKLRIYAHIQSFKRPSSCFSLVIVLSNCTHVTSSIYASHACHSTMYKISIILKDLTSVRGLAQDSHPLLNHNYAIFVNYFPLSRSFEKRQLCSHMYTEKKSLSQTGKFDSIYKLFLLYLQTFSVGFTKDCSCKWKKVNVNGEKVNVNGKKVNVNVKK